MRIGLCLPMMGSLAPEVVGGFMSLAVELSRFGEVLVATIHDYAPHDRARTFLLDTAINGKCDYAVLIDSDTVVPAMAGALLLKRILETKAWLVTGHYYRRGFPYSSCWSKKVDGNYRYVDPLPSTGLIELDATGLGFCVVDVNKVKNLQRPHFRMFLKDDGEVRTWEDGYFCGLIRQSDGVIIGDSHIRVGHLDQREVICDETALRLRQASMKSLIDSGTIKTEFEQKEEKENGSDDCLCEGNRGEEGTAEDSHEAEQ